MLVGKLCLFLLAALFVVSCQAFSQGTNTGADAVLGKWETEGGKSYVLIYKDNETNTYNGKIVWLKEPLNEEGNPKIDYKNKDESLRSRKLLGLELISGFVYKEKGKWGNGKIYNPDDGNIYSCNMQLLKDGRLYVRGFIGISLIGKTQYWTPVDGNN